MYFAQNVTTNEKGKSPIESWRSRELWLANNDTSPSPQTGRVETCKASSRQISFLAPADFISSSVLYVCIGATARLSKMFTQPSKHRISSEPGLRRGLLKSTIKRLKGILSLSSSPSESPGSNVSMHTIPGDLLPTDLQVEVAQVPWYHNSINGRRAMRILEPFPDGSFLLRNSSDDHYLYTVTYKSLGQYGSIRIERDRDGLFTLNATDPLQPRFASPVALLEHVVRVQQPTPITIQGQHVVVYLQHPVGRVTRLLTLQELCKQSVSMNLPARTGIDTLPLPNNLKTSLQAWDEDQKYRYCLVETKSNWVWGRPLILTVTRVIKSFSLTTCYALLRLHGDNCNGTADPELSLSILLDSLRWELYVFSCKSYY